MQSAMAYVMPWNMSVAALEGFLTNTRFCRDELGNLEKQASILTSFTDYVLSENANRWRNIEPFITHWELRSVWNSFFSARPQSVLAKKSNKQWKNRPSRSSSWTSVSLGTEASALSRLARASPRWGHRCGTSATSKKTRRIR
jgi:hypothetical protein